MSEPQTQDDENPYAEEDERIGRLLESHAAQLAERCDSVRIFVTVNRGDGAWGRFSRGAGNDFASYGAVKDWIIGEEERTRNWARD